VWAAEAEDREKRDVKRVQAHRELNEQMRDRWKQQRSEDPGQDQLAGHGGMWR
jgi:hypothetical protein